MGQVLTAKDRQGGLLVQNQGRICLFDRARARRETNFCIKFLTESDMGSIAEGALLPDWLRIVLIGRNPERTLVRIVILVVGCLAVFKFVLLPIRVEGVSMLPNYKENAVNFVNRLPYWFHEPQRGDVVAIRLAGKHVMYLKRIIALPGETIAFRQGQVWINGHPLDEPYLKLPCNWEHDPEQIGSREYFVVGDNRSMDWEEHTKGKAERKRIIGKVLL